MSGETNFSAMASIITHTDLTVHFQGSALVLALSPFHFHGGGGGAQGVTLGILEYLSQSNKNANCVDPSMRWKWVDDLTILEIINLLTIGMSCFNVKANVPNDINIDKHYIHKSELDTQEHLFKISDWTSEQKMMLNKNKTKYMLIFNFTNNYKFSTRLNIEGENEKKFIYN